MAVEALVELFYQHESLAVTEEKKTDAILDGEQNDVPEEEKTKEKTKEDNMEETIAMCKLFTPSFFMMTITNHDDSILIPSGVFVKK